MGVGTRRRIVWAVAAALALALILGVAMGSRAQATSFCGDTIEGTGQADTLVGDRYDSPCFDTISGKGGADVIRGRRLPDTLHGRDDVTTAYDASKDFVDCGPGRDTVHLPPDPADHPDNYRNCERRVTGTS